MGFARRSKQHSFDQALCASPTCYRRVAASKRRPADRVHSVDASVAASSNCRHFGSCDLSQATLIFTLRTAWGLVARLELGMIVGREYFLRKAAALLECAQLTEDPHEAAELTRQASDLIDLVDEMGAPDPDTQAH